MDASSLLDLFRQQADDKAEPYFLSDDDFLSYLTEAEEEASIRAQLIFDKTSSFCSVSLIPGEAEYELDSRIFAIRNASTIDSSGCAIWLVNTDVIELNRINPDWRNDTGTPRRYVHFDKRIEITPTPDISGTLSLEVFRFPIKAIGDFSHEPEIHKQHHRDLVLWILHRYFATRDAETMNETKAAMYEAKFTEIFGRKPKALELRNKYSNRPNRNKAWS